MNVLHFSSLGRNPETTQPQAGGPSTDGQNINEAYLPDGGIFLPQLPDFTSEVVSVTEEERFNSKRGIITESLVEMSDGTLYPVVVGNPSKKQLRSDTAIVFTTAWLTSTKGHNRYNMMRMMKIGYPTIMIGPEGEETNHNISLAKRVELAATTSLFKISHDMNRVLDEVMPDLNVRQDEIITLGESRGAMEAPGFNVAQYTPNRRAVYGDHTSPCFARPPHLSELPGGLVQLTKEVKALGSLALQLPFQSRGRHYSGTVHKNLEYYLKEPFKVPQIMSGQAGTLARAAREDTPLHIRVFTGDNWSQKDEWKDIYDGRDHVNVEAVHGLHLNIADAETLDNITLRLNTLTETRGLDGDFKAIDFKPIIALHSYTNRKRRAAAESNLQAVA